MCMSALVGRQPPTTLRLRFELRNQQACRLVNEMTVKPPTDLRLRTKEPSRVGGSVIL
jgi:hypothetical protein